MENFELKEVEKMVNTDKELQEEELRQKNIEIEQLKAIINVKGNSIDELMEESDFLRALIGELRCENFKLSQEKEDLEKVNTNLIEQNNDLEVELAIMVHNYYPQDKKEFINNNSEGGYTESEIEELASAYTNFGY